MSPSLSSATTPAPGTPAPAKTGIPAPGAVTITSPVTGTRVQECDIFHGEADLPANYTLVLVMRNLSNGGKVRYLNPVVDWQQPAAIEHWTGYQFFGSGDSSLGQEYEIQVVMMPVATVAKGEAAFKSKPSWYLPTLPPGSVLGQVLHLHRVKGAGPKNCPP